MELLADLFRVTRHLAANLNPDPNLNNMQAQIVRAMKAYVTLGGARDPAATREGGGSDSDSWEEPVPADDGDNAVGNDDGWRLRRWR